MGGYSGSTIGNQRGVTTRRRWRNDGCWTIDIMRTGIPQALSAVTPRRGVLAITDNPFRHFFRVLRRVRSYKFVVTKHRIGIIGGTGLYNIEGFSGQRWVKVKTPFGAPSDDFLTGKLGGREVVFLARHGRGHRILPSELNHRANIWAMKKLGVQWILSVSAVGSLQEKYKPCDIVVIDQFVDRTKQSLNHTFFGRGIVAHISFASPVCGELRQILLATARECGATAHDGGTYVNMEGPAFSTRAESLSNHHAGYDVIGMTNLGEAKCAREAEIAYATLAMATDYDCWKEEEHVTLEMILGNLHKNADMGKKVVAAAISKIPAEPNWPCHSALKHAIMTDKKFWPKKTVTALKPIIAKYV